MKEVYHCSPTELDKQDEYILDLHFRMLQKEREFEYIERKRAEQKAKMNSLSHKK